MGYIIIDLEFNNLKNIDKYYKNFFEENRDLLPIDLNNEIIEIGAVKVDRYMKVVSTMKEYIKPTIFPVINPSITEITKINMDILDKEGISFEEATNKLRDMFDEGDVLCSWAKDDVVELILNARYHNYKEMDWLNKYLDIQEYASKLLGHKKPLGLKNALEELRIRLDNNKLHDALNDAEYTVEVLKRIYNQRVINNHVVDDIYNMPAINVKSLDEIDICEGKLNLKCPKCQKRVELETTIKPLNWRFAALGKCPKCNNNILCEILVKKTLGGEFAFTEVNSILKNEMYLNYMYKFENIK